MNDLQIASFGIVLIGLSIVYILNLMVAKNYRAGKRYPFWHPFYVTPLEELFISKDRWKIPTKLIVEKPGRILSLFLSGLNTEFRKTKVEGNIHYFLEFKTFLWYEFHISIIEIRVGTPNPAFNSNGIREEIKFERCGITEVYNGNGMLSENNGFSTPIKSKKKIE